MRRRFSCPRPEEADETCSAASTAWRAPHDPPSKPGRARLVWLREHGLDPLPLSDAYLDSLPRARPDRTAPEPEFPLVPDTHFTTFLEDCRTLMHPDELAQVEDAYARAWHDANEALSASDPWTMSRWVPALLGRLLRGACRSRATVAIRAAQAAFFSHGWLLRIDDERLASLLAEHNPPPLDHQTASLLRGYLDPQPAAAAVAWILVGEEARLFVLSELAADATAIRGRDDVVEVPEPVRPLLCAQLELRRAEGADTTSPLLRTHDRSRNHYAERFYNRNQRRDLMRRIEADTGLTGLTPRLPTTRIERRWNRANGFSLQRLAA